MDVGVLSPEVLSHCCGWGLAARVMGAPQVGLMGSQGGNLCSKYPLIYHKGKGGPQDRKG